MKCPFCPKIISEKNCYTTGGKRKGVTYKHNPDYNKHILKVHTKKREIKK